MSGARGFAWGDKLVVASIALTAGIFVVTAVVGLIALPYLQPVAGAGGLWNTICAAAGLARPAAKPASAIEPAYRVSAVVLTSDMFRHPGAQSIGHGATIAQECAICHGPTGVSRADAPNLAGQYAAAIYKELMDFHAGARVNGTMSPFAANLTEQDMADVAVYYAYLPRLPGYHPNVSPSEPRIVISGAPLRSIAPCGACHGTLDNKVGAPWLEGQPAAYIKAQLQAFASGARKNDIGQQMRNVARRLTPQEIDEIAGYYSARDPAEAAR
ncbi:MAG TPA: c-type cytochrome [Xanthobacteraceae bacterium]|nr:c-type cytochrome [Xanthobacteraceae bacterium]